MGSGLAWVRAFGHHLRRRDDQLAPDPLHGLFETQISGKACVVEYEPDVDLRDSEQVPLLEEGASRPSSAALKPYPQYKDSGLPWLGEVPRHWEIARGRQLFERRKRIVGALGYPVLSITQQGLRVKDFSKGEGQISQDYTEYQLGAYQERSPLGALSFAPNESYSESSVTGFGFVKSSSSSS